MAVLVARQVTSHTPEDEVMKLAPHHAELMNSTGIKRKKNRGKGETTPTQTQTQKKAKRNKQDTVEGSRAIKL